MVLVDTSVMIDYLKGGVNGPAKRFQYVLDNNIPAGINSFVYQEVLQGIRTEKDFVRVKKYLDTWRFYGLKDPRESFAAAARIYHLCRRKGITVSGATDCLIAQTAIENNLFLLHNDSDFDRIAMVVDLKSFHV